MEFDRASWNHRSSTRHRSETNGIAERAVRRVKEGTSAVLLQSGLDERWWSVTLWNECCCCLRNVQDHLADGKTPCERRFGEPFKGPVFPFGALVECHPISARDQSGIHQFGKKVFPGNFLSYELIAERLWKGDILIADLKDSEQLDTSEIYLRRINSIEVLITQQDDEFIFPVADETVRLSLRDYVFREPTPSREPTVRSEDFRRELRFESGESQSAEPTDDAEAVPTSGRSKVTSSIVISMNLEAETFPNFQKDFCGHQKYGRKFGEAAQNREKQEWATVKTKLDNARRLRGIYFIDPDDKEYKESLKRARKMERPMTSAMRCNKSPKGITNVCAKSKNATEKTSNTMYDCIVVESHESTRQRDESSRSKSHEDHIAGKGITSMSHYNLVHKFKR